MRTVLTGIVAVVVALIAVVSAPVLFAQVAPATRPSDTVRLFNGQDLSGWVWYSDDEDSTIDEVWSVVDGNLRCSGKPAGYIRTTGDYESFVLKLQVRHLSEGNGGILLRMVGEDQVWPKSIEAQGQHGAKGDIWNIGEFPMRTDPDRTRGRHTTRLHPDVEEKPIGEWNDYEIILDGESLTLIVNGTVQNTATGCEIVPGKICLQSEGAAYEFRNIELTPIRK